MKKILVLALAVSFVNAGFSQDDEESKKFRFGLKVAPSINWLKPDAPKKFENGGSSVGFNWGLITEFALTKSISFSTGLELNHEKGNITFLNDTYYAVNDQFEYIETQENAAKDGYELSDTSSPYAVLKLNDRKYATTYVTLPLGLKMKTNEIGYMTYFGEFGLNLGFRTGTKASDKAVLANVNSNPANIDISDLTKINYDKDMQLIRMQLQIGLGAEYNLSGSTAVFGAVHYNLGFTNSVKKESRFLVDDSTPSQRTSQKFAAHGIRLTVGVLF